VGAFSHKFSVSPSGETTDRIKKVRGAKMGRTSAISAVLGAVSPHFKSDNG